MQDLDHIKPLLGLSEIKFGCDRNGVTALLGEPSIERTDSFGDIEIEYIKECLRFTFWADSEFKLGVISTERAEASLEGKVLVGMCEEEALNFVTNELDGTVTEQDGCIHEDGEIQTWMDVEPFGLCLWFRSGRLYLIDWFCDWSDNETPKWPAVYNKSMQPSRGVSISFVSAHQPSADPKR